MPPLHEDEGEPRLRVLLLRVVQVPAVADVGMRGDRVVGAGQVLGCLGREHLGTRDVLALRRADRGRAALNRLARRGQGDFAGSVLVLERPARRVTRVGNLLGARHGSLLGGDRAPQHHRGRGVHRREVVDLRPPLECDLLHPHE